MKIITGIGSKSITLLGEEKIRFFAKKFSDLGYVLRSGGCDGSDSIFEEFFDKKEIYLPWKGFNKNKSEFFEIPPKAYEIAKEIHPYYFRLKPNSKKLHARNIEQVLGKELSRPSDIVVCWTKDGANSENLTSVKTTGGTRTAIVLASRLKIPIYNLNNEKDCKKLLEFLNLGQN